MQFPANFILALETGIKPYIHLDVFMGDFHRHRISAILKIARLENGSHAAVT